MSCNAPEEKAKLATQSFTENYTEKNISNEMVTRSSGYKNTLMS